jgi:prepilin-type N-terminal cleavage/methylation domain-containing protein
MYPHSYRTPSEVVKHRWRNVGQGNPAEPEGFRKRPTQLDRHPAFTLIELLAVLAVMLIVLSMVAIAVIDWGRESGMRASATTIERALTMARGRAVAHRESTVFVSSLPAVTPGAFVITNATGLLGDTNYLRQGIAFDENSAATIRFSPRGAPDGGEAVIVLREVYRGPEGLSCTIRVDGVTGQTRVQP